MKTQLTYVGRVITISNKLCHKYLDENSKPQLYTGKITQCPIGSVIECEKNTNWS